MYRFVVVYADNMVSMYDINADDIDDEIDKLCQDDFVIDFKYRRINDDGTIFEY